MDNIEAQVKLELEKQGIKSEPEAEKVEASQEVEQSSESGLSEFEQEQKSKGWNPDGPKSAEEWARNEPLYEEIKTRGREIKQLKKTLDSMKSVLDKQEQVAYQKALADLRLEREHAIQRGDLNLVNQVEQRAASIPIPPPIAIPAVEDFRERHNDWLEGTSFGEIKMQKYAQQRDSELMSRGLSPEKHMQVLEEDIKATFPAYFGIKEKPAVQSVESSSDSGVASTSKKRFTRKDLNSEQKEVLRNFEKYKTMDEPTYISLLVKQGDLK